MKVQIISFSCVLRNNFGQVLSSTINQEVLTGCGAQDGQLIALEKGLIDLKKGEKRRIALGAAEAYGFYDPKMVLILPRQSFPNITSKQVEGRPISLTIDGQAKMFRVVDVSGDSVTLDGNHPLAGQDLVFEIEALSVRDATPEEISESSPSADAALLH